jgi:hypothetical protein
MKTLNDKTKNSLWSIIKNDYKRNLHKFRTGNYPNENIECFLAYVIGEDAPTTKYTMHFTKQHWHIFRVNYQFLTLQDSSTFQAKEWLKYSYQFYNDRLRFLDYFEDGIKEFIIRNKLIESKSVSLNGCLEWIKEEKEKIGSEEKFNLVKHQILQSDNIKLNARILELEGNIKAQTLEITLYKNESIELIKSKEAEILSLKNSLNAKSQEYQKLEERQEYKTPEFNKLEADYNLLKNSLTIMVEKTNEENKIPKIELLRTKKLDRIKLIQYIDILSKGVFKQTNIKKLGILDFVSDKAFVKLLKNIQQFDGLDLGTIRDDIVEARRPSDTDLKLISNEFIEKAFEHFGIEK